MFYIDTLKSIKPGACFQRTFAILPNIVMIIMPVNPTFSSASVAFLSPSTLSLPSLSSGLNTRVCPRRGLGFLHTFRFFASATPRPSTSDSDDQVTSDTLHSEPTEKKLVEKPIRKVSSSSKPSDNPQSNTYKQLQTNRNAATVDPDAFADDFEAEDDIDNEVDMGDFSNSESSKNSETNDSTAKTNDITKLETDSDTETLAVNPSELEGEDRSPQSTPENTRPTGMVSQFPNRVDRSTQPKDQKEKAASTSKSEESNLNKNISDKKSSSDSTGKDSNTKVVESASQNPMKLNFSQEQLEKARSARRAAASEAEKKSAAERDRNKKLRANIEKVINVFGKTTRAFELGRYARTRAEKAIEGTISKGKEKSASSTAQLSASAASAAKSLVVSADKTWNKRLVPPLRKQLSPEFSDISSSALASSVIGVFIAIIFLPSLFSSPSKSPSKSPEVAKLDRDTANLERKLNKESRSTPQGTKRNTPEKTPFPPEKAPTTSLSTEKTTKQTVPSQPPSPPPPTFNAKKPTPDGQNIDKTTSETSKPVPPSRTSTQSQAERILLREVTPDSTMSAVARKLGANANLVLSASFDSLYEEPTVALTVSKKFHTLPPEEQRRITEAALLACRSLGYERVTLTEEESGKQVAQAGIDVDLEDETENLRAQLTSMRATADRLALRAADDEVTIGSLKARLEESRDQNARQQAEYARSITTLRKDNADLADDLAEAKDELAHMPDRMELEQRTIAAEAKSEKMASSVEILSLELAKARNDQAAAERKASEAIARAEAAVSEKKQAIAAADGRSAQASKEADARANNGISAAQREARNAIDAANERVREAEEKLRTVQSEAEKKMRDETAVFNKQLEDERAARLRDVQNKQKEADKRASEAIALAEKEARASVDAADSRTKAAEDKLVVLQKDAASALQDKSSAFEKQLSGERANREKEVNSVIKKYEALLEEAERKSKADLDGLQKSMDQKLTSSSKDAQTAQAVLTKERDDARKETERSEMRAQKASDKAMKERDSLLKRLEKLQNKNKDENTVAPSK